MPINLVEMFVFTYTFGPATAVPYAIHYWSKELIFAFLFACYAAPLPLLFMAFGKMGYIKRTKHKLLRKMARAGEKEFKKARKAPDRLLEAFDEHMGFGGQSLATVLMAFAMGFLWAAVFAYSFRLPREKAYKSILIGNAFGLVFWIFLIDQVSRFVHPHIFIVLVIMLAAASWLYGERSESKALAKAVRDKKLVKQ